ncbi:pentatricopeptide repeat-containing protein At2g13600-like [Andrographis paniculata]|uniref:pentatricopeptide repeat-containing protein At2g13600-like n=1 Tax=Andrographis paniculata TaxID=175694 RepID=UPI0021E7ECAF|nr:pentatricopeptide repeat-containing protein At2g13600-like [Andrographis paniculata]
MVSSVRSTKTFISKSITLLQNYADNRLTNHGAALHCHLIKMGVSSNKYIAVKLLIMYLDSRRSWEIDRMLKEFHGFNVVVHNCLINSHCRWGNLTDACRVFDEMPERNEVSWTALISGLFKYGHVDKAMFYFQRNPFMDVFSWTATIGGLVQNDLSFPAMKLFKKMIASGILPNDITFTSLIAACIQLGDLGLGRSVLSLIVKLGFDQNVSVSNSLVKFFMELGDADSARITFDRMSARDIFSWTTMLVMCAKTGDLGEAHRIFEQMPERNEVTWSAMISKFNQSGKTEEAVSFFKEMVRRGFKPNVSCYSSIISALASLEAMPAGRNVHAHVLKIGMDRNVFVGSSLIDLYSKCGNVIDGRVVFDNLLNKNLVCWNSMVAGYSLIGDLAEAAELFSRMPQRNCVSWNSLIAGHVGIENYVEALELFVKMILSGEEPNKSTFSSVLSACAHLAMFEKGKYAHAKALKLGFESDEFVGTALVDMYAKSGSIECSRKIFDRMRTKNEVVWTALIQGLAENGYAEESLRLFEEMEETTRIAPNELILLFVLFACSHCGLVDKGLRYFDAMEKRYGVKRNGRHYTCVIDMLARSGRVDEAEKFIDSMAREPEANAWAALLNGCRVHGEGAAAERVAGKILEGSGRKGGGYVMVSNMYSLEGRWSEAVMARDLMKEKGVRKNGGCSWVEVRGGVHVFYSQDKTHVDAQSIYWVVEIINSEMKSN